MPLTERERHDAYEALHTAFGQHTDAVIRLLRPDADLVAKDDLAVTTATLRTEMADLRTEMVTAIGNLQATFEHRITDAFRAQTRTMVVSLALAVLLVLISNALTVVLA